MAEFLIETVGLPVWLSWTAIAGLSAVLILNVIAGGALVFLSTMKELPQTLLLRPTEFSTMAVDVWSFASEALFTQAAFSAFILLAISAIPTYILSTRNLEV